MITFLRGEKVILDFQLALLYEVPTKALKQSVKRNIHRFPDDFMFEITAAEWQSLRSQFVTLENSGKGQHTKYLPIAFTELGVAMLSSVLKSEKAIQVNIAIMRVFVKMRQILEQHRELKLQIEELEAKYDQRFAEVFEAIKQLIQQDNQPRNQIGFKTPDKL